MKKLLVFIVLPFAVLSLSAQSLPELIKKADDLYYNGQYKEAIALYEKTLDNKSWPKDTTYVTLLNQLAWAYIDEAQYKKAEPLFTEGKNLMEKLKGKNHPDYAYSCSYLSLLYFYQRQYDRAEPLCLEAKAIREKTLGKEHITYGNSCFNLGDIYYYQRKYSKAEPLYLEAKNVYEKNEGKEGKNYQRACKILGDLYYDARILQKAEPMYIEVKNINEKLIGKEDPVYARSCHNLALLYMDMGQYNKAEALLVESTTILGKALGTDHPDYANSCESLANVYFDQGLYAKAEPIYLQVKNSYEKKQGRENTYYASSCNNLAGLYKALGNYQKAEELYLEAKKIQEKLVGKEHPEYATACNNLAGVYAPQGIFAKAEVLYLEANTVLEKNYGKNHPDYALSCNNLGTLYLEQGLFAKAETMYQEAKNIREKIYGKKHDEYASSCNSLANLYFDQGLYSLAEPLYLEARMIREEVLGKDHPRYAVSCNNLANLYFSQDLYAKAEPLYLEAKAIQEKRLGKMNTSYAMSCNNLGAVYYNQQLYGKAEQLYNEAKDIQGKLLGKESADYAMSCGNLAGIYRRQGNYTKAESFYLEEKNIQEKIYGKEHPLYANTCNNLANLYSALQMYSKAAPLYKEAVQNKLKQIDEVLPTLSEKERDEFYKSIVYYFKRYYDFVLRSKQPALYSELFNLQLQIKGLIFQSTQKMQRQITNSGDALLVQKYESWKNQRAALNKYLQLPLTERAKKGLNVDSLTAIINGLERSLSLESSAFAEERNKKRATWQEVQKKLLPGEAAVEIVRSDSAYIVLIVKPDTRENPEAVILSNGTQLEKRYISYYRSCITLKIEDEHSYTQYWSPIKAKLGNTSKIYVCADGVYHQLNLLTLRNPAGGGYLLNETNIQLVSNLQDLLALEKTALNTQYDQYKIHLVAYPQYDGQHTDPKTKPGKFESLKSDTSQRFFDRGGKIQMLMGTRDEAGNIGALCSKLNIKQEIKLLSEATEGYLKSLKNPTILHIATHGFFLTSEEAGANTRALGGDDYKATRDPLLNSGLLLANAQQGISGQTVEGEDGILTAREALNLTLDKTQLVVMSACETGRGEIRNGEGVYGLQRAFQQAGARTVLISLWKVSDEATQVLMTSFYENLLSKKLNKREAFFQAQLELMKKYPQPYYWGAFVMVGE